MNREKVIQEYLKEKNEEEIHQNELYGLVYSKMLSQAAKDSQKD